MQIAVFPVGDLQTNCYLVWDEATMHAALIDPGDCGSWLCTQLRQRGLTLKMILLTHTHFDHIGGVREIVAEMPVPVWVCKEELNFDNSLAQGMLDRDWDYHYYADGDTVTLDALRFSVLQTPGHTPGSVCLLCEDNLFSGDTLFQGSCGRTDFPGGSWREMSESLCRLHDLPGNYRVFSGHTPPTTLEQERLTNMFMRQAVQDR